MYGMFGGGKDALTTCLSGGGYEGRKQLDNLREVVDMIVVNLDVMLARRKMSVTELSDKVGITISNISILKNQKAKAIRIDTLDKICQVLECQPGELLEYRED